MSTNPAPTPRRRRARLSLVLGACIALVAGCNQDDTVRGAGSIDVPVEKLKFEPTAKAPSRAKSRATRNL